MRVTSILLLTALFSSCSSKDNAFTNGGVSDTGSADEDNEPAIDTSSSDTAIFVQPIWWRLSAGLSLEDGVPVAADSHLFVELLGEEDESLCLQELTLEAVEPLESPNKLIVSWWLLTPTPLKQLCGIYDPPFSDSLRVGIGTMHPDIFAAAGSISAIDDPTPLNAAYATITDDGPLYVYGVAGTAEAYQGLGEAAVEAPLSDELWQLKPVYRFSF